VQIVGARPVAAAYPWGFAETTADRAAETPDPGTPSAGASSCCLRLTCRQLAVAKPVFSFVSPSTSFVT